MSSSSKKTASIEERVILRVSKCSVCRGSGRASGSRGGRRCTRCGSTGRVLRVPLAGGAEIHPATLVGFDRATRALGLCRDDGCMLYFVDRHAAVASAHKTGSRTYWRDSDGIYCAEVVW